MMEIKTEKARNLLSPINVYIIWHPSFTDGKKYADNLYRTFCRDDSDFAGHCIGLPISYLISPYLDFKKIIRETNRVAFVLLINTKMVLDPKWQVFSNDLYEFCKDSDKRSVYPVSFCDSSFNLNRKINNLNLITFKGINKIGQDNFNNRINHLCFQLAHEFCRLLYDRERASEGENYMAPSVKIFLSHARMDGKEIADNINVFVSTQTALKTFIDVNDIPKGADLADSIEQHCSTSVLLAIWTDKYSSREWCQKEIIAAKTAGCPVIVLDALESGEVRRFPYGSNDKIIHLAELNIDEAKCKEVIYEVLLETLKSRFNALSLSYAVDLYELKRDELIIINGTPELYTVLMNKKEQESIVLYPEPPLNVNELKILEMLTSNYTYVTPTFLPCIKYNDMDFLSNKQIGLSISEIGENENGVRTDSHLRTFNIELCRYLLALDANLVYAGDINYEKVNYIYEIHELINNYCFNRSKENRVKLVYLQKTHISDEQMANLRPAFFFEEVSTKNNGCGAEVVKENLTQLRIESSRGIFARIVVGGKIANFKGKYPGIIEEAYIASKKNIPLYVIGAFGGAAELIVNCFLGGTPDNLDNDIVSYFNEIGLEKLNNGLSLEENIELCFCEDIQKNISLILKGLANLVEGCKK